MSYFANDDIAQIATPPENAYVGVIRVSGPNAFSIVQRNIQGLDIDSIRHGRSMCECMFLLPAKAVQAPGAKQIYDADHAPSALPCPARVLVMPGPASYTTEDIAEIHLPGAVPLLQAALNTLVEDGARPALPGEFTFRAFRGGRIDLRQAEAVEEVVRSESQAEMKLALARLGEDAQDRIRSWRDKLAGCAALVEASLDFSGEEIDAGVIDGITDILDALELDAGRIALSGQDVSQARPQAALLGLANAGKSSLFNALLGENAVLVSSEASTTRDHILRKVVWDGTGFDLSDNPGYDRSTSGPGGRAAARAAVRVDAYDIAVWVVDASGVRDRELVDFAKSLTLPAIVVLNKVDMVSDADFPELIRDFREFADMHGIAVSEIIPVSARTGYGVEGLKSVLSERAASLCVAGPWNRREIWELAAARECCKAAADELSGPGRLELAADDLRRAVGAFSRALGEGYAEDMLTRIFSRFCIGK